MFASHRDLAQLYYSITYRYAISQLGELYQVKIFQKFSYIFTSVQILELLLCLVLNHIPEYTC
jgi:hypothetical protein